MHGRITRVTRIFQDYWSFLDWLYQKPRAFVVFRKDDLRALRCSR